MKKIIFYIILGFQILSFIHASIVQQIIISGNNKTPDHMILSKINHQTNISFDQNIANEDIQNLLKMDIFESVQIILNNNIYNITVKEKKIISYAPLIRKEDGIGWSIGPMVNINNINGKAKNIYFSSSMGAIKSGEIKYFNQKILLEYKYNQFKSIESDYTINKRNLFISYIINKRKYTINITPQINNYSLKYSEQNHTKEYKYFSLSYHYLYKISTTTEYMLHFIHNISLNGQYDYSKLFIDYKHIINNLQSPQIIFNTKVILNSNINSPDFENLYIGGENFIRGYYPNPADNHKESQNNLIFKNLIFSSIQFEIPINITSSQFIQTKLLFFYDYGIGADKYNDFSKKNKLEGHGFGISIATVNQMKFDICIGLNHFGSRTIHFIRNIN